MNKNKKEVNMTNSDIDLNTRLARIEVFDEKVVEPSLTKILAKLDGLVTKAEYNERKKYVDKKINTIENDIKNINDRNNKIDGNIFIKAVVAGEKKFVGVIIRYTGLTVLIGTVGFFLLTQFTHFVQDKPTVEVIEKVKEVK